MTRLNKFFALSMQKAYRLKRYIASNSSLE